MGIGLPLGRLVIVGGSVLVGNGWISGTSVQGTKTVYTVLEVRLVSHPVDGAGQVVTKEMQLRPLDPSLAFSTAPF